MGRRYGGRRTGSTPAVFFFIAMYSLAFSQGTFAQKNTSSDPAINQPVSHHVTHRIGLESGGAYVIPTDPFYKSEDNRMKPLHNAFSGHIKYSFGLPSGTPGSQVFADTYQGIGIAYYNFGNEKELGSPFLAYLFQRSKITRAGSKTSIDYEWNFGISAGWHPYDPIKNPGNVIIGSRLNAYVNVGLYLNRQIGRRLTLSGGLDFTHFSNGNTQYPNAGLNTTGLKLGAIYNVSHLDYNRTQPKQELTVPKFPKHLSYDLVLFGSWRKKGVAFFEQQVASPYNYLVTGAYFAPMYNFGYRFRAGLSLDAIYDGSANVYTEDYIAGGEPRFFKPGLDKQIALGVSARGEYVMPLFTIGLGIGRNLVHKGGDLRGFYQSLALKIRATRSAFLHIGYNLKDFHEPNYLMLGFGYRFNDKTPSLFDR